MCRCCRCRYCCRCCVVANAVTICRMSNFLIGPVVSVLCPWISLRILFASHSHLFSTLVIACKCLEPKPPCQGEATLGLLSLPLVYRLCTLCIYFTAPLMPLIIAPRGVYAIPARYNKRKPTSNKKKFSKVFTARYTYARAPNKIVSQVPW